MADIADLVKSLGLRTNPEVSFSDVIDFLVKKYNVNPHSLIDDVHNAKIEKSKICIHRLVKDDKFNVKCIVCDIKYQCNTCENSMLMYVHDKTNDHCNGHYITKSQCPECKNQIEYYICT